MEYAVIEEYDPEQMGERVGKLLKDGWELHGNLLLVAYYDPKGKTEGDKHKTIYAQAMIKRAKKPFSYA